MRASTRGLHLPFILLLVSGCELKDVASDQAQVPKLDTVGVTMRRVFGPLPADLPADVQATDLTPLPDGSGGVMVDWTLSELVLADFATMSIRRLTHENTEPYSRGEPIGGPTLRISPDGSRVAYAWYRYPVEGDSTFRTQIRVLSLAGGTPEVVFDAGPDGAEPRGWAPDGQRIAALRGRRGESIEIIVIPAEGGAPQSVRTVGKTYPHTVEFSRDGRYLAYDVQLDPDSLRWDVYVMDLENHRERRVVGSPGEDRLVGWLPGTDDLLFLSERAGTPGLWRQRVVDGRPDGDPVLARPDLWHTDSQGLTADGRLFLSVTISGRDLVALSYDPKTGAVFDPRYLLGEQSASFDQIQSTWSEDGGTVSFTYMRRGRWTLGTRTLATGDAHDYAFPLGIQFPVLHAWLSQENAIVVAAAMLGEPRRPRLLRLDLETGAWKELPVALPEGERPDGVLTPVPGTNQIVLARSFYPEGTEEPEARTFYVHDPATGRERALLRTGTNGGNFVVSPDGANMAVLPGPTADREAWELWIVPLAEGREPRLLHRLEWNPVRGRRVFWEPGGQAVLNVDAMESGGWVLNRFPLDGGPVTHTPLHFPEGLEPPENINLVRLSPTTNQLVYPVGSPERELWVLEGLAPGGNAFSPR